MRRTGVAILRLLGMEAGVDGNWEFQQEWKEI